MHILKTEHTWGILFNVYKQATFIQGPNVLYMYHMYRTYTPRNKVNIFCSLNSDEHNYANVWIYSDNHNRAKITEQNKTNYIHNSS